MTCEISILKNETGFDLLKSQPFLWFCVDVERARRAAKSLGDIWWPLSAGLGSPSGQVSMARTCRGLSSDLLEKWFEATEPLVPSSQCRRAAWVGCMRPVTIDILEHMGLSEWKRLGEYPLCLTFTPCFLPSPVSGWHCWIWFLWASRSVCRLERGHRAAPRGSPFPLVFSDSCSDSLMRQSLGPSSNLSQPSPWKTTQFFEWLDSVYLSIHQHGWIFKIWPWV